MWVGVVTILTGCVGEEAIEPDDVGQLAGALTSSPLVPVADTRLEEKAPTTNYATWSLLWGTGAAQEVAGVHAGAAMRWDVSSIPAGAVIESAVIRVFVADGTESPYDIVDLKQAWTESGATWTSFASGAAWQIAGAEGSADRGSTAVGRLDRADAQAWKTITLNSAGLAVISAWVDGRVRNDGFLLRPPLVNPDASRDHLSFHSRENTNKPQLEVGYSVPPPPPPPPSGQTPYLGVTRTLPGRIEAEHFDDGGATVAYADTTSGNSGGQLRSTDVDIEATGDVGGGHNVGWIEAGEWLEYTVNVATTGTYDLTGRVAATTSGRTFQISVDGGAPTAPIAVPLTGAWSSFQTTSAVSVSLAAGTRVIRLSTATGGLNVNWFEVTAGAPPPPPPSAAPTIKVVSWNLNQNTGSVASQAAHLKSQHADVDVVLAQETYASMASSFATAMGAGWTAYFHGDSEGVAVIVRTSRLSVLTVENRNIGPSSWGGYREAVRVRVRIDGRDIDLFATHLDWPSTNTWEECGAASVQNSAHACGRNDFVSWVGSFSGHKVYGGDMNARHTGNAVQAESMRQLDTRGVNSCAIHGSATYCDSAYPTKTTRIDHIYRATSMITRSHQVGTSGGLSDHNPVVAVFEVP